MFRRHLLELASGHDALRRDADRLANGFGCRRVISRDHHHADASCFGPPESLWNLRAWRVPQHHQSKERDVLVAFLLSPGKSQDAIALRWRAAVLSSSQSCFSCPDSVLRSISTSGAPLR